jgi:phage baseplate assembly protein W
MALIEIKVPKRKFVDVDLAFTKHPITGDISKKVNENAIITSMKNLILTKLYGRPFHPELSSQVQGILFEPLTSSTAETLKKTIYYVISNFEPRAEILLIDVSQLPDDYTVEVTIAFRMIGTEDTITTQFFLKRSL